MSPDALKDKYWERAASENLELKTYRESAANVQRFDTGSRQRGLKAHEKLVALIEAGDADGAETFWRKHLESIDKLIRESFAVDRPIDLLG